MPVNRRLSIKAVFWGIGLGILGYLLVRLFDRLVPGLPEGVGVALLRATFVYIPSGFLAGYRSSRMLGVDPDFRSVITPAVHGLIVGVCLFLVQFLILLIGSRDVPLFAEGYVIEGVLASALSWTAGLMGGRMGRHGDRS